MRLWYWTHQSKQTQGNQVPRQTEQGYEQYTAYSQLLDRNGQWIGVADTKAGVILAFLVAIFPVFAAPALSDIQKMVKTIPLHANIWVYLPAGSFCALLALFLGVAFVTLKYVLMTLTPRLTRQGKLGNVFFGDIAGQEFSQWQQQMLTLSPYKLALEILEQVHATACIAHNKHKYVGKAFRSLILTIFLGVVLYILSQLLG